jgi:hypothetical protein
MPLNVHVPKVFRRVPDQPISQSEARLQAKYLRDLATKTAGTPSWPFIVLDWLTFRRLDTGEIQSTEHLQSCVEMLSDLKIPLNVALASTIAISAELLGPDVTGIERTCSALLDARTNDVGKITEDIEVQLRAAGLSKGAIQRLKSRAVDGHNGGQLDDNELSSIVDETLKQKTKKVMISYSHEAENFEWMQLAREFATALMEDFGIPVQFDSFGSQMMRDWSVWGPTAIEEADVVLCLASPTYKKDWRASFGSGASDETRMVRAQLKQGKQTAFVVLPGRSQLDIPDEMSVIDWFLVPSFDSVGMATLLRELTDQPLHPQPTLGTLPNLPPEP